MTAFGPGKTKASGATPRPKLQSPLAQEESVMRIPSTIPRQRNATNGIRSSLPSPADYKSTLIDLGMQALSRGEWLIVAALPRIVQARGLGHE
jgi:hypothetical protein